MLDFKTEMRYLSFVAKDNLNEAMNRIYAWYECEVIDRPPIKFSAHNAQYNVESTQHYTPEQWKQRWFDTETVVEKFVRSIENKQFLAETFPVYWPNIGPDVYASFYGCELEYDEVTSWSHPIIKTWDDIEKIRLDMNNEYFIKINELTDYALKRSEGQFLVGYTDLHPGIDCVLAWRGMEQLCYDMIEAPNKVKEMLNLASKDFVKLFNFFDDKLKKNGQLSVTWMEIPSFGKCHIPSADFAAVMSPTQFNEFVLPVIQNEVNHTNHNIFHLDGKGVARHIDAILNVPEIQAIQWVQGVGDDAPIMQWLPLIKKIQDKSKAVMVGLKKEELEEFIGQMSPEGLFLWIAEDNPNQQQQIIDRLKKW